MSPVFLVRRLDAIPPAFLMLLLLFLLGTPLAIAQKDTG